MADSNAQYVIDIAAAMPAGEQTIAQLDALNEQLMANGVSAASLHDAIAKLSNDLDGAKAAATGANAALAAGSQEYRTLENAALQAAKAAERAAAKNGGTVPAELQAKAAAAAAALHGYSSELQRLEANARGADAAQAKLSQDLANARKLQRLASADVTAAAKGFGRYGEQIEKLRGGLQAVGGPLGGVGSAVLAPVQGFAKLSASVGGANAALLAGVVGAVALTAAIVALTVAVVAGTVAIAAWAVGLADSKQQAALTREALEAMRPSLVGLSGEFDALASETGLAYGELAALEKQLRAAKVTAEDMPEALRAAALAERALGKGGAAEFVETLNKGKGSVADLAKATSAALGGTVAKQMRGLDAQSARLKKSLGDIFGGLNIEPVLAGFETLVGIFDKSSASGQTIKFLFEEIFQPIINGAEVAAYAVEAFVLGFLIGATKLYIALKPIIKGIAEFFGFESPELADTMALVTKAGEVMFAVFAVGAAVVGGAFAVAMAAAAALSVPLVAAIAAIAAAAYGLVEAFTSAVAFIRGLDFGQIAADIIHGLVNGLANGASAVKDALVGAVSGAVTAAKNFLGIHSPSTLLYDTVGEPMAAGVETALDDSGPDIGSALQNAVEPPITPTAAAATGAAAASNSDGGSNAQPSGARSITINITGVKDAEDALSRFEELATKLLEGDAASLTGAMVTP